jgi:1-acyl-sn-glycerol-3-phosphate acyltransferase
VCERLLDRLGVTLEVRGVDRVPRDGGLVFMWNQTSHLDHLVLPAAIPRPFHSLYNNELRKTPLYGRLLARGGHFWVDRTNETQWRASIDAAAARVREGACVLVSPEGTRSWDGRLLPMKRGAFMLARSAERPIVCVTVAGAHDRLPRGCAAVRPGRVRVTLSDAIDVRGDDPTLEAKVIATFERDVKI